jgi:nitroreductase
MNDNPELLDVIDAIFTTGAQRRLKPDPVPDWMVWTVLDAAIRGPSGGNSQRWAWVVVTDDEVKGHIGAAYLDAWNSLRMGRRARVRRQLNALVGRQPIDSELDEARKDPNYRSGEHLANNIARAPVWIFAAVRGIKGEPSAADGADIFGAVQNLMLAARKLGLGTTLTMLHRRDEASVASMLGLPNDARALVLIPMGFPTTATFVTNRRRPVETVTHWERWGSMRTRPTSAGLGGVDGQQEQSESDRSAGTGLQHLTIERATT